MMVVIPGVVASVVFCLCCSFVRILMLLPVQWSACKSVVPIIWLLVPGVETLTHEVSASVMCLASCGPKTYSSYVQITEFAVLIYAATAWCTCQVFHIFLPNILSFCAFHIYHIVMRIFCIRAFSVESVITIERTTWTPSSSFGRVSVRRGGVAANQTALSWGE